uniref:Transposase n=1 Tax=Heterorhabditis bacteriophora TaxID=37862 RepID=A0A1I7X6E5_HETBA
MSAAINTLVDSWLREKPTAAWSGRSDLNSYDLVEIASNLIVKTKSALSIDVQWIKLLTLCPSPITIDGVYTST